MNVISWILTIMFIAGGTGLIVYNIVGIVKDVKQKRKLKERKEQK